MSPELDSTTNGNLEYDGQMCSRMNLRHLFQKFLDHVGKNRKSE